MADWAMSRSLRSAKALSSPPGRARSARAPRVSEAEMREILLKKIRGGGNAGVAASRLAVAPRSLRTAVLADLVHLGEVRVAKVGRSTRYLLPEFETVEAIYHTLDAELPGRVGPLLTPKDLSDAFITKNAKSNLQTALQALIKEKRLLQIVRGRDTFHLHLPSLRHYIEPTTADDNGSDCAHLSGERVVAAWKRVRARTGYEDVSIHELRQEAGLAQGGFGAWLLEEMKAGRWLLSTGDPLYASEAQRADAVQSGGRTFLFARYQGERAS
jgi:integrase